MAEPLTGQTTFDDYLDKVLTRFAAGNAGDLDQHLQTALAGVAQFVEGDYAYLIQVSADFKTWSATHEWRAPGVSSYLDDFQDIPMGTMGWNEQRLLAGDIVRIDTLADVPSDAGPVRSRWESLGFKSVLQVPLRGRGGQYRGCLGLSAMRREVTWSEADIKRVKLLCEAIANVLEPRRAEAELRRLHDEVQQRRALAVAASLDGLWEWETASDTVQYSDRFLELLGYHREEVANTLAFFRLVLHPADAQTLWDAVDQHLRDDTRYDVECRLRTRDGEYRWFRTRGQSHRDASGRPVWMAGSLQDIHAQKTAQTDLADALRQVEHLSERLRAENVYLQEEITASQGFDEIVGESDLLLSTLSKVEHVATTDASVLLLGETGTGKELFARAIHQHSPRKDHPLIKVNLAALPSSLLESELFGHVKGAFTGALADKLGRFQLADGGTLFLDEIGDLEPDLQTKLLRVLQEGEFERIGSGETIRVDVRVVTATNRDLHRAMEQGKFRLDLYYRLAVFPIEVPPLRLRREDIPLLVWHFIAKKQARLGKAIHSISKDVMDTLVQYDWPGNVRELENVVERALILSPGPALVLHESLTASPSRPPQVRLDRGKDLDRARIVRVLEKCLWKIKGPGNAADRLGLKPSTLRYRMKVLGIARP